MNMPLPPLPPRPQRMTPQSSGLPLPPENPQAAPTPLSQAPAAPQGQTQGYTPYTQEQTAAINGFRPDLTQTSGFQNPSQGQYQPFIFHVGFLSRWMKKALPIFAIMIPIALIFAVIRNGFSAGVIIVTLAMFIFIFGISIFVSWILSKTSYAPVIFDMNSRMVTLRGETRPISDIAYVRFSTNTSGAGTNSIIEFGFNAKQRTSLILKSNISHASKEEVEFLRYVIPFTSIPLTSATPKKVLGGLKVLIGQPDLDEVLQTWLNLNYGEPTQA